MNYMEQVAEMLGVEMEEEFKVRLTQNPKILNSEVFEITRFGIMTDDGIPRNDILNHLMTGIFEIVWLPWKPKEGDMCYYITPNGGLASMAVDISHTRDLLLVHNGMVYRTAKEAMEHKDETMRQWTEIRKELEG